MKCPTPWLGSKRGYLTDWITQRWVCLTGRRIEPASNPWLLGARGDNVRIGADFFKRLADHHDCEAVTNALHAGLINNFEELASDNFAPENLSKEIVSFYESTSGFQMDVWSEWSSFFRPFGWLLRFFFSYRLQQLHMPISPLETSHGISSDIIHLLDRKTRQTRHVGWLRTMIGSGDVIYVGIYSLCAPPKWNRPCVKVVFPLPNGHATVIMKAEVCSDGSLKLHSSGESFGDAGFYFVVEDKRGRVWARHVRSMKETIHVYVDEMHVLRTDHVLKYFGLVFLRLHYRMTPKARHGDKTTSPVVGPVFS